MKSIHMKKLAASTIVAATIFATVTPAANAVTTAPTNLTVQVSLTSVCTVAAIPNLSFGTYTAFGSATVPAPTTSVSVTCTRGFAAAPTLAFDATDGVVAGLNYSVSAGTPSLSGGTNATPNPTPNGTPDVYSFLVTGSMASGQAGTNSTGVQSDVRTVTITY